MGGEKDEAGRSYQRDELENLVERYPVWPGDTISHASMDELRMLGFAVRQADGNWIPTEAGVAEWERVRGGERRG